MNRGMVFSLVALIAFPLAAPAQETLEIKLKKLTTGTVAKVDKKEEGLEAIKITDNDGNKIQDVAKKKNQQFIYTETILERIEGAKRPIRLKRAYDKAVLKTEEGDLVLPFQGKTVLIEKVDGRYRFHYDNDAELPEPAAKVLDEEFNKKKDEEPDFHHVLLPQKAVKVGESWDLPAKDISKGIEDKDGKVKFDNDKSKGTGKLLKAYTADGQKFGVLSFRLEFIPLAFIGDDGNEIKVQPDARLIIDLKLDGCIDGSLATAKTEVTFRVNAVAHVPNAEMPEMRFIVNIRAMNLVDAREVKK